jgi:hypothetical protein
MDDERVREGITHKTGQLLFFDVGEYPDGGVNA